MISVIVPAYNAAKYIDRCIESVINQSEKDFEIIVIDDGSTDDTWIHLQEWEKKSQRVLIIQQNNQGLSGARNTGLLNARGEFIFFLDSDDWIENNAFECLLKKQKETKADIVACGFKWVYEDGRCKAFTENKDFCGNGEDAVREMILGKTVCSVVWNKLYKRELFNEESFRIGKKNEDEFITYRILYKAQKVVYIQDALYAYFQNERGLLNTIYKERNYDKLDALWERSNWLRERKKLHLVAISDVELLNYVKFLYRAENITTADKQVLKKKYVFYCNNALKNPKLQWNIKIKAYFWRIFL